MSNLHEESEPGLLYNNLGLRTMIMNRARERKAELLTVGKL